MLCRKMLLFIKIYDKYLSMLRDYVGNLFSNDSGKKMICAEFVPFCQFEVIKKIFLMTENLEIILDLPERINYN